MTQHQVIRSLKTGIYIDGVWTQPHSRGSFGVEDPPTGEILTVVADASPDDGVAALDAAAGAQESWAATPPRVRADIPRQAFEAVTTNAEDFATLMTLQMGRPIAEVGGVKQSGLEREGGLEGIEEYLEKRYVGLAGAI